MYKVKPPRILREICSSDIVFQRLGLFSKMKTSAFLSVGDGQTSEDHVAQL